MRYFKFFLVILLMNHFGFSLQPQDGSDHFTPLPADLQAHITSYLTSGKTLEEVINNIRALSEVNKTYNNIINDAQVTRYLISTIAKRFNVSELAAAFALKTAGSKNWTDIYINKAQKDTNVKNELAKILQKAIQDNDLNLVKYILSKMPILINEYVLDTTNGYMRTPLVQAIRYGRALIVDYLLKNKADFSLREQRELLMRDVPPGTMDKSWNLNNLRLATSYAKGNDLEITRTLINAGIAKTLTEEDWKDIFDAVRWESWTPEKLKLLQNAYSKSKNK